MPLPRPAERPTRRGVLAALLLAVCLAIPGSPARAGDRITVFAAASLTDVVTEAAREWEAETGVGTALVFAGSSALARQIEAGAPADLFLSANADWMDHLEAGGHVEAPTRITLASNRLAVIAPADGLTPGEGAEELLAAFAAAPTGRLAVANTDAVPAGLYAKAALREMGLWERLRPHMAEASNVRAALLYVSRGEAPLGIVYATDAAIDPGVRVAARIPAAAHPPIAYPGALVAGGDPRARDFLAHLVRRGGLFAAHGFAPPATAQAGE